MDKSAAMGFPVGSGGNEQGVTAVRRLFMLLAALGTAGTLLGMAIPAASAKTQLDHAPKPERVAGSCPRGSKPAVIAGTFKCLRVGQHCATRYQTAYRRYGFHCVNGRLRQGTGIKPPAPQPPTPPPPPTPAPPAQVGHYKGLTSQLTTFEFDVTNGGYSVTNLTTGQVNAGCTPHFNLSGGEIHLGSYVMSVASDGTFGVDYAGTGTIGGTVPYTGRTTITGHITGPTATGTLQVTLGFTYSGTSFACGSGLQTWTASRIG